MRRFVGALAVLLGLTACGASSPEPVATDGPEPVARSGPDPAPVTVGSPTTEAGPTAEIPPATEAPPGPSTAPTAPPATRLVPVPSPAPAVPDPGPAPPASVVPPEDGAPAFGARIDGMERTDVARSWHEGCPVHHTELRLVTATYWGFDGTAHTGGLVVHADVANDLVTVLSRLYDARFPLARMTPVEEYGGDDDASMAANNTSAFNCREVTGRPGVWSEHSYGRAIDINPVQNPYVNGSTVLPTAGSEYLDRTRQRPGMIHDTDVVVRSFAVIGWSWGGSWSSLRDYQHFSRSGR